jgi:hypothetical protein
VKEEAPLIPRFFVQNNVSSLDVLLPYLILPFFVVFYPQSKQSSFSRNYSFYNFFAAAAVTAALSILALRVSITGKKIRPAFFQDPFQGLPLHREAYESLCFVRSQLRPAATATILLFLSGVNCKKILLL